MSDFFNPSIMLQMGAAETLQLLYLSRRTYRANSPRWGKMSKPGTQSKGSKVAHKRISFSVLGNYNIPVHENGGWVVKISKNKSLFMG